MFSGLASTTQFNVVSDGHGGTMISEAPVVTMTVDTVNGIDFQHNTQLVEMGRATVQGGGWSGPTTILSIACTSAARPFRGREASTS